MFKNIYFGEHLRTNAFAAGYKSVRNEPVEDRDGLTVKFRTNKLLKQILNRILESVYC